MIILIVNNNSEFIQHIASTLHFWTSKFNFSNEKNNAS